MLWVTNTTLNIQSFMGAIMAVGVAVANADFVAMTFAEQAQGMNRAWTSCKRRPSPPARADCGPS